MSPAGGCRCIILDKHDLWGNGPPRTCLQTTSCCRLYNSLLLLVPLLSCCMPDPRLGAFAPTCKRPPCKGCFPDPLGEEGVVTAAAGLQKGLPVPSQAWHTSLRMCQAVQLHLGGSDNRGLGLAMGICFPRKDVMVPDQLAQHLRSLGIQACSLFKVGCWECGDRTKKSNG